MNTNINYLLEEFGISVNNDAVIRTVFSKKYFHPKECHVQNGVANNEIVRISKGKPKESEGKRLLNTFASKMIR